jgi:hypothetical protein
MPKKKSSRKAAKKAVAPQIPAVDEGDVSAIAGENSNVESDAPPAARRSMEADSEAGSGDVERFVE